MHPKNSFPSSFTPSSPLATSPLPQINSPFVSFSEKSRFPRDDSQTGQNEIQYFKSESSHFSFSLFCRKIAKVQTGSVHNSVALLPEMTIKLTSRFLH